MEILGKIYKHIMVVRATEKALWGGNGDDDVMVEGFA